MIKTIRGGDDFKRKIYGVYQRSFPMHRCFDSFIINVLGTIAAY